MGVRIKWDNISKVLCMMPSAQYRFRKSWLVLHWDIRLLWGSACTTRLFAFFRMYFLSLLLWMMSRLSGNYKYVVFLYRKLEESWPRQIIGASSFCAVGFTRRKVSSHAGEKITFYPYMVLTCTETFYVILKNILFSSKYVCNNCRSCGVLIKYMPDF